jgi:hypothetical protein
MKIEIDKQYMICPYNRWAVNEEELMVGSDDKKFIVRMEWKRGTFLVTPRDEDEREALQLAVDAEDDNRYDEREALQLAVDAEDDNRYNELVSSYFTEFEMYETTDGNSELDFTLPEFSDEEQEKIQEAYDEDWISGLEELGYSNEDGWWTLWGKVVAEEHEDSNT